MPTPDMSGNKVERRMRLLWPGSALVKSVRRITRAHSGCDERLKSAGPLTACTSGLGAILQELPRLHVLRGSEDEPPIHQMNCKRPKRSFLIHSIEAVDGGQVGGQV